MIETQLAVSVEVGQSGADIAFDGAESICSVRRVKTIVQRDQELVGFELDAPFEAWVSFEARGGLESGGDGLTQTICEGACGGLFAGVS